MSKLQINTRVRRLAYYLDDFEKGNFRIPFFQRRYKWEAKKRRDLFDSIIKGFPIGTILLWKPNDDINFNPEYEDRSIGSYTLEAPNDYANYILDGYQRLSTIVGCLLNPNKTKLIRDEEEWLNNFNLIYNFKSNEVEIGPKSLKNLDFYKVPLYQLADTKEFYNIQTKFVQNTNLMNEEEVQDYVAKFQEIAYQIQDYVLPSVDIIGGDFDTANQMFVRVNTQGEKVNEEEQLSAITSTESFRLGSQISDILDDLEKTNFLNKKKKESFRENIFRTIQSSFGALYLDSKATDVKSLSKKNNFSEVVNLTLENCLKTVAFFKNYLAVFDLKYIPANLHFIFLVQYFNIKRELKDDDIEKLQLWFWQSSYTNCFTKYNPAKRKKAFEHFLDFCNGKNNDPFYWDEEVKLKVDKFPDKIDFGGVRKQALALYLVNYAIKKENILSNEPLNSDKIRVVNEYKIFRNENSIGNTIFIPFQRNELNKQTSIQFILSQEFKGKFSELLITDKMRELYAEKRNREFLELREKLIEEKENEFITKVLKLELE
ncbi:MAG: DUF262 domain-containing protein [Flavobacterium sp.]|uniref:DUF262 domain-containing protein n=1 Tax=Flavobacterium sp. TaxID=239 RepID=UPI0022BFDBDD|nr:DUF262 domain-containing protein [Flavobacterium sp.]MCZ8295882.1 DUF262 domain-containing protein [Flavobacterium sp.]